MNGKTAREILKDFYSPHLIDTLKTYADDRIEGLQNELLNSNDVYRIFALKGAINELRQLHKIRDYAAERVQHPD